MIFTSTNENNFQEQFNELLQRGKMDIEHVSGIVQNIINEIKNDKNSALKTHISKFDNWTPQSDSNLKIHVDSMKMAYDAIDADLKASLHLAYDRIKTYHEKQLPKSWIDTEPNGTILGQKVTAVDSAGLYISWWKSSVSQFTFNECYSCASCRS